MSLTVNLARQIKRSNVFVTEYIQGRYCCSKPEDNKKAALQKKLREKTPIGKLDELEEGKHPHQEKEPLTPWPDNTNPHTGEIGGPRGPEPTRYGDWERKGRVTDF
ncbi:hypothetical protein J437_LFUL016064 [Ladona fulva]|uniref:Succinate dehydrogenase assembly factor 4, mitochondrial n=1 Tax=Ladona fulva TaxID=123851 RepID=A0A8K0PA82_LADFU|nr:hypothetical protein J437_LFUL016064 [Ladona fulva]